jgi:hypothetical protein
VNRYQHFTLRLVLISTLISISIVNIRLIKRTKDTDKAEDKALAYIKKIVQEILIIKKDTKKVKEIKYFNRKSATFVIN